MTEFTASNGVHVSTQPPLTDRGPWVMVDGHRMSPNDVAALREFFLHERDEELGRWRWPENPDYVVSRSEFDPNYLYVLNERTSDVDGYKGPLVRANLDDSSHAARAFFDAHPEPKPWHGAECGDVWYLDDWGSAFTVMQGGSKLWFSRSDAYDVVQKLDLTDPRITTGRRIWPEATS